MNSRLLHEYAWPDEEGLSKLKERMTRLNMSARAFDRILRVWHAQLPILIHPRGLNRDI